MTIAAAFASILLAAAGDLENVAMPVALELLAIATLASRLASG